MIVKKKHVETLVVFFLAIWLHLFNVVFVYAGGLSVAALQGLVLISSFAFSIVFILFFNRRIYSIKPLVIYIMTVFFAMILSGVVLQANDSIFYRFVNFFYLNLLVSFSLMTLERGLHRLMYSYGCIGIAVIVFVWFKSAGVEVRNDLEVQPNYIGMVVLTVILSAVYIKNILLKSSIYILGITVLIHVSSRTSLLCSLIVIAYDAFIVSGFGYFGVKSRLFRIGFIILYSLLSSFILVDIIADIFLLNDEYRGLDSGLSGRDERWEKAALAIISDPFMGAGFGESTKLLGFTADNAYLTLALELGVFGLLLYIILNYFAFLQYIRTRQFQAMVILIIYWIYGVFEKRYFSVGNSLSIIYLFCLYHAFLVPMKKA